MNALVTLMKLSHHRQITMKVVLKLDSYVLVTPRVTPKITKNVLCEFYLAKADDGATM